MFTCFTDERQFIEELFRSDSAGLTERDPLDHVEATLAAQDVADGGLAQLHFLGERFLGQSGVGAHPSKHPDEFFLIRRVDRLCHTQKDGKPGGISKKLVEYREIRNQVFARLTCHVVCNKSAKIL